MTDITSNQLEEENARLRSALEWAWDNLKLEIPQQDPESEYDFCAVCGKPDWKHRSDCEGITRKKEAESLIRKAAQ